MLIPHLTLLQITLYKPPSYIDTVQHSIEIQLPKFDVQLTVTITVSQCRDVCNAET